MNIHALVFVELTVANWPASVAWYREALGLEVVLHDEEHQFALLRPRTALPEQAGLALKAGRPVPGTARLTFEVADLPSFLDELKRKDIGVEGDLQLSPEGYRRVRLRDPDGHGLCLYDWIVDARASGLAHGGSG